MEIYLAKVFQWLEETKKKAPQVCDWIGVYFKEGYLYKIDSTDLVIGPYIGEVTDHVRISIDRGFCGMALREERTVNVDDVTSDSTHIACSLKTRSELVIPIADRNGNFVAELDIDCNRLKAFTPELQAVFEESVKTFPLMEDYIPLQIKKFETQRLILRPLEDKDANAIFAYASNSNVAKNVTWEPHQSLNDTMKFIIFAKSNYLKGTAEPLGIILKDDIEQKVIGCVGLMAASPKNRILELAYVLDEKHWGKGILVEASQCLLNYAFNHYALERVQARCKVENTQSARVMEKLGMKYEGTLRSSMLVKNKNWDLKMYSILKSEWNG
ncbi:MAG: GNAT family N-acetyltransferase [Bacteriovorax sp.]|jgi:ribosomal-protein-alanine N-acetyltransferase